MDAQTKLQHSPNATFQVVADEAIVNIAQRGASDLLKQYVAIKSPKIRSAVLQLVKSLADDGSDAD